MIEVIDNFLPSFQFKQIQSVLMDGQFSWYYNDYIGYSDDKKEVGKFQFVHTFFNEDPPRNGVASIFYPAMEPSINKLNVRTLHRIKANLNPRTIFHRNGGWHIDYPDITTSVYYINTNNGWTQFKKGGKVKSIANRLVKFDSNLEHAGFTCTDEQSRVVVNFNYKPL